MNTAIKFQPSSITNILRACGLPIAMLNVKRGIRKSGVSVSHVGRAIVMEFHDWANDGTTATMLPAAQTVLGKYGYEAVEVRQTGLYRICNKK